MTNSKTLTGVVLDETIEVTIEDLCRSCSVQREMIVALIEEGVLMPVNADAAAYRFPGVSVRLVIKAVRLQRDLDLNIPGIALALELMEEIERLRDRLRVLE